MAVQTMKMILKKSGDEYLALLNYGDTELHNGYSSAQLSTGRKLRTRVPCHLDELKPKPQTTTTSGKRRGSTTQK